MSSQEYRYILRIMGTDVQGTLKTSYAVAEVKGVSAIGFDGHGALDALARSVGDADSDRVLAYRARRERKGCARGVHTLRPDTDRQHIPLDV